MAYDHRTWPASYISGQPPLPREEHPGIPSYRPPFAVPHAPQSLSQFPWAQQGTPRATFSRMGVRSATPEPTPPPVYAWLLQYVFQKGKQGPSARVLVAQTLPSKGQGIVHDVER